MADVSLWNTARDSESTSRTDRPRSRSWNHALIASSSCRSDGHGGFGSGWPFATASSRATLLRLEAVRCATMSLIDHSPWTPGSSMRSSPICARRPSQAFCSEFSSARSSARRIVRLRAFRRGLLGDTSLRGRLLLGLLFRSGRLGRSFDFRRRCDLIRLVHPTLRRLRGLGAVLFGALFLAAILGHLLRL